MGQLAWGQLSGGQLSWGQLSGEQLSGGQLSGGGSCPVPGILNGEKHFVSVLIKYFKPTKNNLVLTWKIKLSNESIKPPPTPDNSLNPKLDYFNNPKFPGENISSSS